MPTLDDQITVKTADEVEQTALDLAQAAGLPVTGWAAGRVARTIFRYVAVGVADLFFGVTQIAKGGVMGLARAGWLTRLMRSEYDEERLPARATVGRVTLVDHGGGPHAIVAGAFYVATLGGAVRFKVTSLLGGVSPIPLNGSMVVEVEAVSVGSRGNVPNLSIVEVTTAAPTLTVTNPAIGTTGTWITTLGTDEEGDDAATARVPLKWATLSPGSPPGAYLFWALSTPGVTRAAVDDGNPDGPNTVAAYVDNAGSVATLQTTLDAKKPSGTAATAYAATASNITIPGTVTVRRAFRSTAQTAIEANLAALALSIDIGGVVREAEVIERVMTPEGVVDFEMGSSWAGVPNIQLGTTNYPQFTLALTYVEVE